MYTGIFTCVKLFKAVFRQKDGRRNVRVSFAFCTKFELLFLHMYNLHNSRRHNKRAGKFELRFL